jgi:hypothetical protein
LKMDSRSTAPEGRTAGVRDRSWALLLGTLLAGILIIPMWAWRFSPKVPPAISQEARQFGRGELLIGRDLGWAGFAVYDNDLQLPTDIASMHLRTFRSVLFKSAIETSYHSLLDNDAEVRPPFSVLVAHGRGPGHHSPIYAIGPISLFERQDVRYWRVRSRWLPHVKTVPIWQALTIVKPY